MAESPKARLGKMKGVKTTWISSGELPTILSTELALSYVGDVVYLTFGQVQLPELYEPGKPIEGIQIQPVVKLALTESSFHKIAALFEDVRTSVPDPRAKSDEASE